MEETIAVFPEVRCTGHGKLCYVKTGVKDGPSKGVSFLVCPVGNSPCQFTQRLNRGAATCPTHSAQVELQCVNKSSSGETKLYFRCKDRGSQPWCGSTPVQTAPYKDFLEGKTDSKAMSAGNGQQAPPTGVTGQEKASNAPGPRAVIDLTESSSASTHAQASSGSSRAQPSAVPSQQQRPVGLPHPSQDRRRFESTASRLPSHHSQQQPQAKTHGARPFAGHVLSQPPPSASGQPTSHPPLTHRTSQGADGKSGDSRDLAPAAALAAAASSNFRQPPISAYATASDARAIAARAHAAGPDIARGGSSGSGGAMFIAPLPVPTANVYIEGTHRLDIYATNRLTRNVLEALHQQHELVPEAAVQIGDPVGLRGVTLMPHQKHALAWLRWRELQTPHGGILADDMGLGKTLTVLSHILKCKEDRLAEKKRNTTDDSGGDNSDDDDFVTDSSGRGDLNARNATLIVVPASIIMQWHSETEKRFKRGSLAVHMHHGANRTRDAHLLARNDIVLTTYGVVRSELAALEGATFKKDPKKSKTEADASLDGQDSSGEDYVPSSKTSKKSRSKAAKSKGDWPLFEVRWRRAVLDEAHEIRNPKTSASKSVCELDADCRWALSGTPIQNDLMDLYSLLKFLRCAPFDDIKVWKHVTGKGGDRLSRLNTVVKAILLRRTKDLINLPCREIKSYDLSLSDDEKAAYDSLFQLSRSAVAACIKQSNESAAAAGRVTMRPVKKGILDTDGVVAPSDSAVAAYMNEAILRPIKEFVKENKNWSVMLVMLLRLRQCCCHLGLLARDAEKDEDEKLELSLEEKLADMSLVDDHLLQGVSRPDRPPCFSPAAPSTKIVALLEKLTDLEAKSDPARPTKSVIVSQWTSMLDIIQEHLDRRGMSHCRIDGSVSFKVRHEVVEKFNTPTSHPHIMLLSLKAGGVGLNLIGGNHLFLMDVHWNPAQEQQAFDRIYRMGQTRDVVIHKFLTADTIEQRIIDLQKKKTALADGVLSGSKSSAKKLTLQDMRMLFSV